MVAPGDDIFRTSSYSQYANMSGTSMAAPHVSGPAALIWALKPTLTADQVARVITGTAHDTYTAGLDERTGWGRVDAYASVLETRAHRVYLPAVSRQSSAE